MKGQMRPGSWLLLQGGADVEVWACDVAAGVLSICIVTGRAACRPSHDNSPTAGLHAVQSPSVLM